MECCRAERQRSGSGSGSKFSPLYPIHFVRWQILSLMFSVVKFSLFLLVVYMLAYADFEFWQDHTEGSNRTNPEHENNTANSSYEKSGGENDEDVMATGSNQALTAGVSQQRDESYEPLQAFGSFQLVQPPNTRNVSGDENNLQVPAYVYEYPFQTDEYGHPVPGDEYERLFPADEYGHPAGESNQLGQANGRNYLAPQQSNSLVENPSRISEGLTKDKSLIIRTICEEFVVKTPPKETSSAVEPTSRSYRFEEGANRFYERPSGRSDSFEEWPKIVAHGSASFEEWPNRVGYGRNSLRQRPSRIEPRPKEIEQGHTRFENEPNREERVPGSEELRLRGFNDIVPKNDEESSSSTDLSIHDDFRLPSGPISGISSYNRSSVSQTTLSPVTSVTTDPARADNPIHNTDSESSEVVHEVSLRSFIAKEQQRPYDDFR